MFANTEKILFLKRVPMFSSMTFEQLHALSPHLELQHFLAGEVLFYEGEVGQQLYIIVRGQVHIIKHYRKPHACVLASLYPYDFFGEMGIFENTVHSATVLAPEETEVLVLHADKFRQVIYQHPTMALDICRELSVRLRRSTAAAAANSSGLAPPDHTCL